jgi:hypothetical protein
MGYLVPVVIIALGLVSQYLIEVSAELSTATLLDAEPGVDMTAPSIVADRIVDMRPETSLNAGAEPDLPDLRQPAP